MRNYYRLGLALALLGVGIALGYLARRAGAAGIPLTNTMYYTGSLQTFGSPDNGTHLMQVALFLQNTDPGAVPACATGNVSITCVNGQFSIPLTAACVTVIHQNATVWVQLTVDANQLGMTPLAAVPYAVEADTASNAAAGSALAMQLTALANATVSVQPPLAGTGAATNPITVKNTYPVWGRTACGGSDNAILNGYIGGYGSPQGPMSGMPMCLSQNLAPSNWVAWSASLVTRSTAVNSTAGNRSEYMSSGNLTCSVCAGYAYTLWGTTTCGPGDTAIYTGHVGGLSYDSTYGGAYTAGPVCIDDNNGQGWTNWGNNTIVSRGAGSAGSPYAQYLEAPGSATCVMCQ